VATNELPAVRAAGRVLQYFDRSDIDRSRVKLVIDRFNPGTGLAKDEIQRTLESDVMHVLPNDYQTLQKALIDGKPAPAASSFGKSLHALANALSGKTADKPEKAKAEGTLWSLFGSLLSRRA
jgi:Flp pilus assembly CpaE family ATPase